jgi:hypothetical protein
MREVKLYEEFVMYDFFLSISSNLKHSTIQISLQSSTVQPFNRSTLQINF